MAKRPTAQECLRRLVLYSKNFIYLFRFTFREMLFGPGPWLLGAAMLVCMVGFTSLEGTENRNSQNSTESNLNLTGKDQGINIVSLKWHHVKTPYLIAVWILVAGVAKLGM